MKGGANGLSPSEDLGFNPVFVVGYPRSGTTLLATLLGRHSELAATPESHFVDEVTPSAQRTAERIVCTHDAILDRHTDSIRVQDLDVDTESLRSEFLKSEASYPALFQALLQAYGKMHGKPRVVEKTPAHLPFVPVLLGWFPNAKVICIVRDGRDAVLSRMAQAWTHNNLRLHCLDWRWWVAMGNEFEDRFPDNILQVSFEAMLSTPREALESVCKFIEVEFEEAQLDPAHEASGSIPKWEAEWKQKAGGQLDSGRIAAWRGNTSPKEQWLMHSMMGRTLEQLDYPDAGMGACPLGLRAYHGVANRSYRFMYHPLLRPRLARVKRLLRRLGFSVAERNIPESPVDMHKGGGNDG